MADDNWTRLLKYGPEGGSTDSNRPLGDLRRFGTKNRTANQSRDQYLSFKKNPDEKYFCIMEKFHFEKIFFENFENIFENPKIPLAKNNFPM